MLKLIPAIACVLALSSCASLQSNSNANSHQQSTMQNNGLISMQSNHSVKQTADRFESIAKDKGLTLFTRIDHQQNAMNADLTLKPTEVIIFGNPKAGTPLMNCAPSVAIDLPQKVLISEDAGGLVALTYNDPSYLKARHNIKGCDKVISNISMLLNNLAAAATAK
ncbi:DUF302 domain-containing protein [Psychrobacter sp. M13]|uniref:DUF302 domain-containing protein n=1 Tax=Psychrobacter sp. M13 TaxID=3067275 RepID=UPI00273C7F9C|nr:DUF302 domain-containing protein [Psychrobacter sp. M13]WLP95726.1 DUF302 domain-containing protein [Psychrobacter sp. M13]